MKLVFRTDVHASDHSPASWKGDYLAEIVCSLDQIATFAKTRGAAAILDGGDFFHVKAATRNSHALVQQMISLHRSYGLPVYAIEGNHDIAYNNLDSVGRQPIGVMFAAGVFQRLRETVLESDGLRVRLVGVPYDSDLTLDALRAIRKQPGDTHLIVLAHCLAAPNPSAMTEDLFGEPVFKYSDLMSPDGPDVWCFPPGTPVLDALYRPTPIEQVSHGTVLGRGLEPNDILAVHPTRFVDEDLVTLDIEGVPSLVQGVTSEHPYWIVKGMHCALPSRVNRRCHPDRAAAAPPCSSCADAPDVKAGWVRAGDIVVGDYVAIPVPTIPSDADSCPGLARLLGYYVAEGHIIQNRKKEPVAGVAWSFHEDEGDLQEDVRALVLKHFGLETYSHPTTGACTQVCAYGREIADFFSEHGGQYSDRKSLSSWIWQRSVTDRMEFLVGWLLGDGHARKSKTDVGGATASPSLAFQVFFLALSLGLRPCFTIRPPTATQNHPSHIISFYGDDGESLSHRLGITPPDRLKTKVSGFFDDGLYYVRVRGVSHTPYKGPVHNFRTSTGEYVVGGVLVHNCFGHWHKDQGITTIGSTHFVNTGSVSRGALTHENITRQPKAVLLTLTSEGVAYEEVPLTVAPPEDVFDFAAKTRAEEEKGAIAEFVSRLQLSATTNPEQAIENTLNGLEYAKDVRDLALNYLERARTELK